MDTRFLEASPELDSMIATMVMGSPKHQWVEGCGQVDMLGTYEGCSYCSRARRPPKVAPSRDEETCIKAYSTDIACAWEVVEKLGMFVGPFANGEFWAFESVTRYIEGRTSKAKTGPLAICREAIRIVSG
jgi:hypothetical protein